MVLNNHTATLKAVDNRVYFDVDSEVIPATFVGGVPTTSIDTDVRTVPVGFVMAVTPQISDNDEIIVNIRPTITRADPADDVADPAAPANLIPTIRVREMESVLRLNSGQIAVLGGLMQDNNSESTDGVPVLSDFEDIGAAFTSRDNNFVKTELVIFIRPWVIRTPSVEADLQQFRRMLPENLRENEPLPTYVPESKQ